MNNVKMTKQMNKTGQLKKLKVRLKRLGKC